MNIVYIHVNPMPSSNANTINVARMCEAMAADGHTVTLIYRPSDVATPLPDYYGLEQPFELRAIPWGRKMMDRLFALAGVAGARMWRAELIYTRNVLVALTSTFLGVKTVLELHAPPSEGSPKTLRRFRRLVNRRALVRVLANSQSTLQDTMHYAGARKELCRLAPHGVVMLETRQSQPPPRSERITACYAGSFWEGRGVEFLLEVAERCPEVDFELIGATGGRKQELDSVLRTNGLSNVRIVERVSPAQAQNMVRDAEILLAPYRREVFHSKGAGSRDSAAFMSPLKIFEYMATGCPIVASDLPAIREVLVDGETALLCDPDDVSGWASAISRLAQDSALRSHLGSNALTLARKKYSWQARARLAIEGIGD